MNQEIQDISEVFEACSSIEVIRSGMSVTYNCDSPVRAKILKALSVMNEKGYEMPALGVSLDRLTKTEMKTGVWLKLNYDEVCSHFGMTFDCLVIGVQEEYCGYNIIRGLDGKYEGRVYYYNLSDGNNMKPLSDCIKDLVR